MKQSEFEEDVRFLERQSMYFITRSCPSCGAPIELYEEMTQTSCPYCGMSLYVTDKGTLSAEIRKEMSRKTLTEKYENFCMARDLQRISNEERLKKLKGLEEYGFIVNEELLKKSEKTAPAKVGDKVLSMLQEAVGLIKPSKWKKAKTYQKKDVRVTVENSGNRTLSLEEYYSYIKYKWPDETVHYWRCDFLHGKADKEFPVTWLNVRDEKENLVRKANSHLRFSPLLYGGQEYIILKYKFVQSWNDLVLFRDGYVFDESCFAESASRSMDEEWMLKEIQYINGDLPEPKERITDYWKFVTKSLIERKDRF